MNDPVPGGRRCWLHNGNAARGIEHPRYKGGGKGMNDKYRSALPESIAKHYKPGNANAVSCVEEIALIDARVSELMEQAKSHEVKLAQRDAKASMAIMKIALEGGDMETARTALQALEDRMNAISAANAAWAEVPTLMLTRSKLANTEINHQRLVSDRILVEHIQAFMEAIVTEARALTEDRKRLETFTYRVTARARGALAPALTGGVLNEHGDVVRPFKGVVLGPEDEDEDRDEDG